MMLVAALVAGLILIALISLVLTASINRRFPPVGRFQTVTGDRIHVVDRAPTDAAPAATVLLIHGASAALGDQLLALSEVLSPRYRLIAVDRPGQGWSDRPEDARDASPVRQATLIFEALRQSGVERAIVVGHSFGAAVAAALALEHRGFVQGLVLVAPATHPWPGGVAWYYRLAARPFVGPMFTGLVAPILGSLILEAGIRAVFQPQSPPDGYSWKTGAALAVTPLRFHANGQDIARLHANVQELSRRYHEIEAPCAIITGDRDNVVWPSIHSEGLARDIKGSKLVALAGIGHMPHHARPDAILTAVDEIAAAALLKGGLEGVASRVIN